MSHGSDKLEVPNPNLCVSLFDFRLNILKLSIVKPIVTCLPRMAQMAYRFNSKA